MTMTKNAKEFLSAFDGCVDQFYTSGTKFDALKLVKQFRLSNRELIAVQSSIKVEDLELLAIGADEQLVEGYSNISKAQQRELLATYHAILEIPTTLTREKKVKDVKESTAKSSDAVKAPKAPKLPKLVVETVVENFDAVFAIASKYRCLRTFITNVVIAGSKITADSIQEYRYTKDVDSEAIGHKTKEQFIEFMKTCSPIEGGSVTLLGKCIDTVHKFN